MASFACGAVLSFIWAPVEGALERALGNAGEAGLLFLQNWVGDLIFLGRKIEILAREMAELRRMRNDTMREVEIEEVGGVLGRTDQVKGWVEMVDTLDAAVAEFQTAVQNGTTCLRRLHLPGQINDKLKEIQELRSRRTGITQLVSKKLPDVVEAVPSSSRSAIIGGEETLAAIQECLKDDRVGMIGIYGMGGIGKTTLLKKINNDLIETGTHNEFDVVIWVTVSRDMNILKVQRDIGIRVGLSFLVDGLVGSSYQVEEQAKILFRTLLKKKFLLFLDDVWEMLDLIQIGVPFPDQENKCKVAFATRSEEVCIDMGSDVKIKVNLLDRSHSWELFRRNVGANEVLDDPSIQPLVEKIVSKCGGLPIALITVGRAMANKRLSNEWEYALKALDDNAKEVRGMEKKVLYQLKFSYDKLENDTLRTCLLYCSLFPEDLDIDRDLLIEYWIGEGFLDNDNDDTNDIDHVRNRGHVLITSLKAACLLDDGEWGEEKKVKMHDTVRDMALWLTGGEFNKANKFLAHAGKQWSQVHGAERWGEARRISLMFNAIEVLPNEVPNCPCLLTLLMNWNFCTFRIPYEFFCNMVILRVLDLSYTPIEELPTSIGLLTDLQFLNLSGTSIESVPKELGNLVKLRQLNLSFASRLSEVPHDAISTLSNLQALNVHCVSWDWKWGCDEQHPDRQASLGDLEGLRWLNELRLGITTIACIEEFLHSSSLPRFTRALFLKISEGLTTTHLLSAFKIMRKLEELIVQSSDISYSEDMTLCLDHVMITGQSFLPLQKLRRLYLGGCNGLRDLTWVRQLPCLNDLEVQFCDGIEQILLVNEDSGKDSCKDSYFPVLRKFDLFHLPRLWSICRHPLLFPSLNYLSVIRCPQLKKFPLGPYSAKKIKEIGGEQDWWDRLDWDRENGEIIKSAFVLYFNAVPEFNDEGQVDDGT